MTLTDFGLSVFSSWLANRLERKSIPEKNEEFKNEKSKTNEKISEIKPAKKLFQVYDVYRDLGKILKYIDNPCAHIIVENEPSSFYHLASLVIEDLNTGVWFVFNRGRMSFQGTGGGAQQTELAVSILKNAKVPVAPWVTSKVILDDFEKGYILWQKVKCELIPLVSSILDETKWPWIQMQAKEVLYDETEQL